MKKRILSVVLSVAMAVSCFAGVIVSQAAGINEDNYCADISEYRTGEKEDWTYPTKDGYVFAGWYSDDSYELEYALEETDVTGGAYAKFVPKEVLSAKLQLNALANIADETVALRMLTTVDSLNYQSVGFDFNAGTTTTEFTSTTVYESVLASGKSYGPKVFSDASEYILVHSLTDIPKIHYASEFTITPKWVTLDGTEVTGVAKTFNIKDDYKVAEDKTMAYPGDQNGARWIFWFNNIKVNAGQWITYDVEGLPVGTTISTRVQIDKSGKDYAGAWVGATTGNTVRVSVQIADGFENDNIGLVFWRQMALAADTEITVSNIRITDYKDMAYYREVSDVVWLQSPEINWEGAAGKVLSFCVDAKYGTFKESFTGTSNTDTYVYFNGGKAENAYSAITLPNGKRLVQIDIPATGMTKFQTSMRNQSVVDGRINEVIVSDIKILDTMTYYNQSNNGVKEMMFTGRDIKAGQILTFEVESDCPLNVYVSEDVADGGWLNKLQHVSWMKNMKGKITISWTFTQDTTEYGIRLQDANQSSNPITYTVSNIQIH